MNKPIAHAHRSVKQAKIGMATAGIKQLNN